MFGSIWFRLYSIRFQLSPISVNPQIQYQQEPDENRIKLNSLKTRTGLMRFEKSANSGPQHAKSVWHSHV